MKYYIFIVGCAMNYSDAERLKTALEEVGYIMAKTEAEADLLIAVSCSVRQAAVDRIYAKGQNWKKKPHVITALSGCVLETDKKKLKNRFDYIFKIEELEEFISKITIKGQVVEPKKSYFDVSPCYESTFRAHVPIMTGCDNFCSYCAVPYVRGREKSRPENEIIKELRDLVNKGYKEIILLGQNVNSYQGVDYSGSHPVQGETLEGNGFVNLIKEIDKIPGDYRVYFYSNHPKDISDELIKTLPKLKHFPNYLHLPLQSGNNEILRKMNRNYTKEDYLRLVSKIKEEIPGVALTTDIMVGFPGETQNQFKDTKETVKQVGFDMAFLAQYSPRPETASAKMEDDVPKSEKKIREAELQKIIGELLLKKNKKLEGKSLRVLIDSKKKDKYYGRTESYKVVEVDLELKPYNQEPKVGEFYEVKIEKAESWKLLASF